jgi:hypothetical protein
MKVSEQIGEAIELAEQLTEILLGVRQWEYDQGEEVNWINTTYDLITMLKARQRIEERYEFFQKNPVPQETIDLVRANID